MKLSHMPVALIFCLLLPSSVVSAKCPQKSLERCDCHLDYYKQPVVSCVGLNMTTIPSDIPKETVVLVLSNNPLNGQITEETLANLPNLKILDLDRCKLSTIPSKAFAGLGQLTFLNLAYNPLTSLHKNALDGLTSLETLHITHTQLESIPDGSFDALEQLKVLRLEYNNLQNVQDGLLNKLQSLRDLRLSGNRIPVITEYTFKDLLSLELLYLAADRIEKIHPKAFHGLHSLFLMDFTNNPIVHLHPNTFKDQTHYHHAIHLTGLNKLECDCSTTEAILKINKIQVLFGSCKVDGSNIDLRKLTMRGCGCRPNPCPGKQKCRPSFWNSQKPVCYS